jgi:hypothetical protein
MYKLEMNLQTFGTRLSSQGTTLSYDNNGTTKKLARVKSIPQIGNDPEKLDVTDLDSVAKEYIPGIPDSENLEFAFVDDTDNFNELHSLVEAGASVDWTITYPNGREARFGGIPTLKLDGVEVNQAVGFSLVVVVDKPVEIITTP